MKIKLSILGFLVVILAMSSCSKSRVPCPGNGQHTAADLSLFDADGNLKSDSKKKKKKKTDDGLVNKKQDDRLKARRKRYLGDTPKHMKK